MAVAVPYAVVFVAFDEVIVDFVAKVYEYPASSQSLHQDLDDVLVVFAAAVDSVVERDVLTIQDSTPRNLRHNVPTV